jgi:TRAP-type uncharacterized transport system substrate-binding protein
LFTDEGGIQPKTYNIWKEVIMKFIKTGLIFSLLVTVGLLFTFAGASAESVKWPKMLVTVSGGHNSPGHIVPLAWTPLHQKDTGVKWRVIGAAATAERIHWLKTGKAQVYYREMHSLGQDIEVGEGYEQDKSGQSRLRIALPGFRQWFGICTFADSGIKTIKDIKPGTTYTVPVAATTLVHFYNAFRRYLDMTPKELVMVAHASFPGAFRAFGQGQAKLVTSSPTGGPTIKWMNSPHGLRFLNWPADSAAEARFAEYLPDVPFGTVELGPKPFRGVRMPVNNWVGTTLADLDPDVVYNLVKWMDENYNRVKGLCTDCTDMTLKGFRDAIDIAFAPIHLGTIRYLREKGMWSEADEARQKYNLWLNNAYIKVYTDAMNMAKQKGLKIAPDNKAWVQLWRDYKKESGLPKVKIMTDDQITAGLRKIK